MRFNSSLQRGGERVEKGNSVSTQAGRERGRPRGVRSEREERGIRVYRNRRKKKESGSKRRRRDSEVWSLQIHTSFVPLPTGGSLRKQLTPRLQAPSKIRLQTDKYWWAIMLP